MKILDFVRQITELGISVIPLRHRSKEPMIPAWEPYQNRLPTHTQYQSWFASDWHNYGVICGWCNLVVLDFDNLFYFELWRDFMRANGMTRIFETCFKVITSHGFHVYLRTAAPAVNEKRISRSGGIDVQAVGKYVVGPGCVHPNGAQYVPVGGLRLIEVESVEAVLPSALFPPVAPERTYHGAPVQIQSVHTEYCSDPFALATDTTDLITKVKRAVRIESLFAGVQRSSTDGRWLKALCPFHQDKHQSAWIDTLRQLAGCQVCGMRPMDVLNVYARMHNISERAAVVALADECGVWR